MCSGDIIQAFRYSTVSAGKLVDLRGDLPLAVLDLLGLEEGEAREADDGCEPRETCRNLLAGVVEASFGSIFSM